MKAERYRCLVFDWDGTLVDSIARIVSSLQVASEEVCDTRISEQQARSVIGLGLVEALQQLHPELDDEAIGTLAQTYSQHFLHENPIEANLFDGVTDMLEQLRSAGYSLAIATGKSRRGLERALREHRLESIFTITCCADELPSKPQPDMLLAILDRLAIRPGHSLMIGDSEHDLIMARNARVGSIAVTHGVHPAEVLQKHQPLACLDRVTDLSAFLSHNE